MKVKRGPAPTYETERWVQAPLFLLGRISPRAFQLACWLTYHCVTKRHCWPSLATLAREAHCHPDTIRRTCGELESEALVRVQGRFDDARQLSNVYRLLWAPAQAHFAPIPIAVLDALTPIQLVVLCAHWKFCDYETALHKEPVARIADLLGISCRTISRTNSSLRQLGFLGSIEDRRPYGRAPNWTEVRLGPARKNGVS